mgnify:CR=1 FL=1
MREWDASFVKAPKGAGEPILYLDFDGVLHHEAVYLSPSKGPYLKAEHRSCGHVLFQHAPLLVEMLDPYPAVKIVLSTSWVRTYGCYGAAKRLPPALRKRVIGATFHSRMREDAFIDQPRGVQVRNDVRRRQPRAWLALDDDWVGWPTDCLDNFVRTDEVLGISDPDVLARFAEKLSSL